MIAPVEQRETSAWAMYRAIVGIGALCALVIVGVTLTDAGPALPVNLGFDEDGRLAGAAIEGAGMGYQDTIRVLYAYSFEERAITGLKVLETRETPGLGDKIETEPHFIANFEALDARLDDSGSALRNPIVTVKQGEKTDPWQIDGITGATITSEAIGNILNDSAGTWVPILERDAGRLAPETPR